VASSASSRPFLTGSTTKRLPSFAALAVYLPAAGEPVATGLPRVEVFASADSSVALELGSDQELISTTAYEVDAIERFQALLSKDLPPEPEIAKRTALTRIGQLDAIVRGGSEGGRGLPIGNLPSQFFPNVYLDVLDRYVKE